MIDEDYATRKPDVKIIKGEDIKTPVPEGKERLRIFDARCQLKYPDLKYLAFKYDWYDTTLEPSTQVSEKVSGYHFTLMDEYAKGIGGYPGFEPWGLDYEKSIRAGGYLTWPEKFLMTPAKESADGKRLYFWETTSQQCMEIYEKVEDE